jgi:hypothetical protein
MQHLFFSSVLCSWLSGSRNMEYIYQIRESGRYSCRDTMETGKVLAISLRRSMALV